MQLKSIVLESEGREMPLSLTEAQELHRLLGMIVSPSMPVVNPPQPGINPPDVSRLPEVNLDDPGI